MAVAELSTARAWLNFGSSSGSGRAAVKNKASVGQLTEASVLSQGVTASEPSGASRRLPKPSFLDYFFQPLPLPSGARAGAISGRAREIDIFRRVVPADIHQRFFVMLFREEHVERWNDEQREDCSDGQSADENETD